MRLLIPKARAEQSRWQAALAETGLQTTFVDPWLIEPLPESPEQRTHWLNLDAFSGVVCISPAAAQALVQALDNYWPMPPAQVHWLCNGPRTARSLQAAQITPKYPSSGHTAEDVLALPETQVRAGDKWLIVKGEGGRVTYPQILAQRGADVVTLDVYRRSMDMAGLQQLRELAPEADALWLSSEYLGEQLMQQDRSFWQHWPGQWWVSSSRLATWLNTQGCNTIQIAAGATPEALCALARQVVADN